MSYIRYKHKRTWHWIVGTHPDDLNRVVLTTACGSDETTEQEGSRRLDTIHQAHKLCAVCAEKIQVIYDTLVKHCGAYDGPDRRAEFAANFPDCVEFRFGGRLGGGGKVYFSGYRLYVGSYPEDRTDERDAMIAATNEALALVLPNAGRR